MSQFVSIVSEIGSSSLNWIWFPLLMWTAVALPIWLALKINRKAGTLFQYYGRVALMASLPAGLFIAGLIRYLPEILAPSGGGDLTLLVVNNPFELAVNGAGGSTDTVWSDPALIAGWATALVALVAAVRLGSMVRHYIRIHSIYRNTPLSTAGAEELGYTQDAGAERNPRFDIRIAFSNRADMPFTFGWRKPIVVIPEQLKHHPEKLNMALRHEQQHIKRGDYAVNTVLLLIKSIFWFHPLIHLLYSGVREYREISCDLEVLSDRTVSRKQYARLLFELAAAPALHRSSFVSMSVNKSTLKKRINIMTTETSYKPSLKKSIIYSLSVLVTVSAVIACSDLQSTGFTNEDLAKTQQQIETGFSDRQPLYTINGEIPDQKEAKRVLARIKPKYIKTINVLKGSEATEKYGERGSNGVIEMILLNKDRALADLQKNTPGPDTAAESEDEYFVVAENMPKLKGGLKGLMEKISYPEEARNNGVEGRVIVQFIVNEQGEVEDPQIIEGIGSGCDREALRIVRQASFEPGMQDGKPVRVQFSLPVVYRL